MISEVKIAMTMSYAITDHRAVVNEAANSRKLPVSPDSSGTSDSAPHSAGSSAGNSSAATGVHFSSVAANLAPPPRPPPAPLPTPPPLPLRRAIHTQAMSAAASPPASPTPNSLPPMVSEALPIAPPALASRCPAQPLAPAPTTNAQTTTNRRARPNSHIATPRTRQNPAATDMYPNIEITSLKRPKPGRPGQQPPPGRGVSKNDVDQQDGEQPAGPLHGPLHAAADHRDRQANQAQPLRAAAAPEPARIGPGAGAGV